MKRKVRAGLILFFAVVFAIVLWQILRPRPPEPVYAGKPQSYWIAQLANRYPDFMKGWDQLGTNSTLVLVAATEFRNTPIENLYRKFWPRMPVWVKNRWPCPLDAGAIQGTAIRFLCEREPKLGCQIIRSHENPEMRDLATRALAFKYDKEVTEALLDALNDKAASVRNSAAIEISIGGRYPDLTVAVPALIPRLRDDDALVRENAARSLLVFPSSYPPSREPSPNSRLVAALDAKPDTKKNCIATLKAAAHDTNSYVHEAATTWLYVIAPEQASKLNLR